MNRRMFLAGLTAGAGLAQIGQEPHTLAKPQHGNYLSAAPAGRTFSSVADARDASMNPGDVVMVRDFAQLAPRSAWSPRLTRGKWHLCPYKLAGSQQGRLLIINDIAGSEGPSAVPEDFSVPLNLPGWYAIWIGVPMADLRPWLDYTYGGVDVALDVDPAFVLIAPDRGIREGKIMGPMNVEVMCFWKCAKLDGRSLRVRVPYGTYLSLPWGTVRGSISCLKLVRLSEDQVRGYENDISNPKTKRVIVVNDGFSAYWEAGEPWKDIDTRFVQQYRNSDVGMYFLQTPSTGVASWPSKVTSLLGEGVTEREWKLLRMGDHRAYEYIQWATKNRQEGFRVATDLCRKSNLECHASLRMNLFFKNGKSSGEAVEEYFNGPFWRDHPELRKPGGVQLDYGQPGVRHFIRAILMELAANYDVNGINLDFTRWPPVASPARDDFSLLTNFIVDVRRHLDEVAARKGRKLVLSVMVVDGYQARDKGHPMNLADQKIDLEAWLASRTLDFICVEAWNHSKHLALAKRFHTPYYAIQDQESIETPNGYRDDPTWQSAGRLPHDPTRREEFSPQPPVNSCLDPLEYNKAFLPRYELGVDGACVVNACGNFIRRLGHIEEMAEHVKMGTVWGQQIGSRIQILQ